MEKSLVVIIPFLVVCTIVGCLGWWLAFKAGRLKKFAVAKGLAYQWRGPLPIVVPQVVYGRRGITETSTCLYGPWNGIEVFACDIRIGSRRGNVDWIFIVAIHAQLHDTGGLDTKRWNLTPLNGWTFLIPTKPNGGALSIRKVTELWDALSAAAQPAHSKAVVMT